MAVSVQTIYKARRKAQSIETAIADACEFVQGEHAEWPLNSSLRKPSNAVPLG